jgi:hypothetical protein
MSIQNYFSGITITDITWFSKKYPERLKDIRISAEMPRPLSVAEP